LFIILEDGGNYQGNIGKVSENYVQLIIFLSTYPIWGFGNFFYVEGIELLRVMVYPPIPSDSK
jgi:hypothetical protein